MNQTLANIFSGDAFSALTLTDSINMTPILYGLVNQLGIFEEKGIPTTTAMVEINNGVLNLIKTSPRGTTAPKNKPDKRDAKSVTIPRVALDDRIFPEDVQDVREFGTLDLRTPSSVVNDRLIKMARKHDLTDEYLKCGALQGVVKDADGSTIQSMFTLFGVSEQTENFTLSDDDFDCLEACVDVTGQIMDNLQGDTMTGVMGLWPAAEWKEFITHPSVKTAYANYMNMTATVGGFAGAGANPLRDDVRTGFYFGGILHREYRGKGTTLNGDGTTTTNQFIAASTARFFPLGTTDTFRTYYAPADWMEAVNTIGQKRYAKIVIDPAGEFAEVRTRSNPLPLCLRPKTLIKGVVG